jgi:hypothetical protein
MRKETPSTEPVAAATISLFFSKRNRLQRAFNVVADVEKLDFVLGAEERLLALRLRKAISSRLLLSDPPPLGARAPPRNTSTRPLPTYHESQSPPPHQRLCRVTDLHGCYQDSSLSAVGAAPGVGLRWPSLVVKEECCR